MIIANPIYDSVFKYLLEDLTVAKLMLSTIIEEEIIDLDLRPQEMIAEIEGITPEIQKSASIPFVIYRLDFAAKIRKATGEEEVLLLELQKIHLLTDIFRFRKYLGEQLASKNNIYTELTEEGKIISQRAYPIRPIYILGHGLQVIKDIPVIKIQRQYIDAATLDVIEKKDPFMEALSHDAIVVCVQALPGRQRTDLERMLNVFNQKLIMENEHFIAIDEQEYPQKFQPILRRLNMATQDATVKQQMETEDVIIDELRLWDINLQRMKKIAEEAEAELEKAEGELENKRNELQKTETELQKAEIELQKAEIELQKTEIELQKTGIELQKTGIELQKKDNELQKKDNELQKVKSEAEKSALNEKKNSARTLVTQGVSKETVAVAFGISPEVLEQWLGNK